MIGMHNLLLIIIVSIIFSGCGEKSNNYIAGLGKLSSEYRLGLGISEQNNLENQLDIINHSNPLIEQGELSFYIDLDNDGITDFFDKDIDGDNIHNLIDSHPLDSSKGGEDENNNQVEDFIENAHIIELQKTLKDYGIALIDFKSVINVKKLNKLLFENKLIDVLNGIEIINFSSKNEDQSGTYNNDWASITIYSLMDYNLETLIHESFHHFLADKPLMYEQFTSILKLNESTDELITIAMPSTYATTNLDEALAETYMFYWCELNDYQCERFNQSFVNSQNYKKLSYIKSYLQF